MTSLLHQLYPQGIASTVQRQIDRVPEPLRSLLQGAAVAGLEVDPTLLRQLIGQRGYEFQVHTWLVQCVSAAILEIEQGQCRFVDDELRSTLLAELSEADKLAWHVQIATALETIYPQDPAKAASLAHHWQQAGNVAKERHYAVVAGEYASQQFDHDQALAHFSQALLLTAADDLWGQFNLLLARELVYHILGDRDAQKDDLIAMAEIGDQLASSGDNQWRIKAALRLGAFAEATGEYTVAIVAATEALRLAATTQNPAHEAASHLLWGQALLRQGKYEEAREKLQLSQGQALTHLLPQLVADSLRFLGVAAADLGQFDQAQQYYEEALPLYRELEDKHGESTVLNNLSVVAYSQNQLVSAMEHWQQAHVLHQAIGDKAGSARVLSNLSTVCMDLGEYEKGRAYSQKALTICREIDLRFGQGFNLINLSLFSFYLQSYQHADVFSQAALKLAREMESLPLEGMALKDRAYLLRQQAQWPEAEQAYHQALAIWQQLVQPLQTLEAQAGLAQLALDQGNLAQAQTFIQPVLTHLQAGNTLAGTSRQFYIYLVCYEIVTASGDPLAATILQQAHDELMLYAQKIVDESRQQAFLHNVPEHRQIRALFEDAGLAE